jgi:uncharacterized protein YkwD
MLEVSQAQAGSDLHGAAQSETVARDGASPTPSVGGRPATVIHFFVFEEPGCCVAEVDPSLMRCLRRTLSIAVLAGVVAAAAASGAGATGNAGEMAESLLATRQACPSGYRRDAPLAVQVRAMECLVAFARAQEGVQPLRPSEKLARVAALKVDADLACDEFSHTPCGAGFMASFEAVGYGLGSSRFAVAENLAWGLGEEASPEQIMRMWLESPEHRKNLLSPKWREFGLGVRLQAAFLGNPRATVWANEFGIR